ncbi:MAG: amidase, partial [Candidatus Uhrbacteria bacterium]|nr:amidase [Candidatus Uhrbacteria bacterium]
MQYITAKEIRDAVVSGETTAEEIVRGCFQRIKAKNEKINAFLEIYEEDALAAASKIDEMRDNGESLPRLAGVPIAIKDNILVKGHIASAGSKMLENYTATYDATVIQRLKDAGAIIIVRTNMDEFAMGSSNETSFWGNTANPWDVSKVPGGSSGGS